MVRYAKALRRWSKAGRPVRDREEVRRLFYEVCSGCEHFGEVSRGPFRPARCGACGCRIAPNGRPARNKLAMETEQCPHRKW